MGDASEWYADQLEGEERERRDMQRRANRPLRQLTPYDTGQRAEPKIWPIGAYQDDHPDGFAGALDSYGKVDLEDDSGATIATVWAERAEGTGAYTVVIEQHLPVAISMKVYD